MDVEIVNAKIESTMLGIEDHGIFTFYITLDLGGSSISFGGYQIDQPEYGIKLLAEVLKTLDLERWEELRGEKIRARLEDRRIVAIGHYLDDKWINPREFYDRKKKKK